LVTRPEPGASATAQRLAAMGHAPVLAPCLTISPLKPRLPEHPAAVVITSGQAIDALPKAWKALPVFCVGDATAGRLRAAGFHRVESAAGDAEDLFKLVTARAVPGLHVLAVGERQGVALERRLRAAGLQVARRKVYAARPLRALPGEAAQALAAGALDAALFYSAETARSFVRLRPEGTGKMLACALSERVAGSLHGLPWREIRVALAPSEMDLMALIS
jgi:uroporphyrinogen-III synthase